MMKIDWRIGSECGTRDMWTWQDIMLNCHNVDADVFHDMGSSAERMYQDGDDWPTWP